MNNVEVINEQEVLGKTFRVYGTFEEPLFLAKDVANWIEHTHTTRMLESVDEDEKLNGVIFHAGQNREMTFLTEDGLYEVLMQSRKPIAKQFKKEVKKILKALRKGEVALVPQLSKLDMGILQAIKSDTVEERLSGLQIVMEEVTKPLKEENETLKNENETLTPKANIYDRFLNGNGTYKATQIAKLLGISSAQKLNKILNEDLHLIYKQGKDWIPYANTNTDWFKMVVGSTSEGHNYSQLKITPKGVIEISKLLELDIKEEDLESLIEEE